MWTKVDITKKQAFEAAGINVDSAMKRFMDDEDMYCSFLNRFLTDNLINELSTALSQKDIKHAFDVAHTMKGVCANLSLDAINAILNPMVEVLRKDSLEGLDMEYERLLTVYSDIVKVVKQYCQS